MDQVKSTKYSSLPINFLSPFIAWCSSKLYKTCVMKDKKRSSTNLHWKDILSVAMLKLNLDMGLIFRGFKLQPLTIKKIKPLSSTAQQSVQPSGGLEISVFIALMLLCLLNSSLMERTMVFMHFSFQFVIPRHSKQSRESKLEILVQNKVSIQRIMDMLVSIIWWFLEEICWWNIMLSPNKENILCKEMRRSHMQLC